MYFSSLSVIRSIVILFVLIYSNIFLFSQSEALKYDENMLDFWIGEWDLHWTAKDSSIYHGHNKVHKFLGDKIIYENFSIETGPNKGYVGKSWSVFANNGKEWKQTWVDTQGSYLDFTGKIIADSIIFEREMKIRPNQRRQQRMVFYDIKENSLSWSWQHRDESENGKFGPWMEDWTIYYKRKK